jgi:hypothetical protein
MVLKRVPAGKLNGSRENEFFGHSPEHSLGALSEFSAGRLRRIAYHIELNRRKCHADARRYRCRRGSNSTLPIPEIWNGH